MAARPRKLWSALKLALEGLGPAQIEALAKAVAGLGDGPRMDLARCKMWRREHPKDKMNNAQIRYWSNYISTCDHISKLIRQSMFGPRRAHGD